MTKQQRMIFALKIDTDNLNAALVHALTLCQIGTGICLTYTDPANNYPSSCGDIPQGIKDALVADTLVVQTRYAINTLTSLYGADFSGTEVIDLLTIAKRFNRTGNSLSDVARRHGIQRIPFRGSKYWSPGLQKHAVGDAKLIALWYEDLAAKQDAKV